MQTTAISRQAQNYGAHLGTSEVVNLMSKVDGSLEKEIYLWDFPPSSLEFDSSEYALAEQAKR